MKCKLIFDAISGYFTLFVFTFLVTLGVSFFSDWRIWYISFVVLLALLGIVYCVLLLSDQSYRLIIDANGVTFKNKLCLFSRATFISWASVASYYNYTYPFDHEMQPEYLVLVCTSGKKQKIVISGLDYSKDEILVAVKRYYASATAAVE